MDYTAHYDSPLGGITLGSDGKALIGLWFDGQKYFADVLDPVHEQRPDLPVFEETRQWLDEYFSGQEPQSTPPLTFRGSDFRKRVWQQLLEIPYGQTVTYGQLAQTLGCKSAQAVGGLKGVTAAEVNLGAKTVTVTGTATADEVRKAVEAAGFEFKGQA